MSGLAADSGTESNASAISGLSGSAAALATPLPEGPTNGPIYVPAPTVDATRVAGLATTLGITQPPTEQPGGWSAEMANADPHRSNASSSSRTRSARGCSVPAPIAI